MSESNTAFIDTNVWLYAFMKTVDIHRNKQARNIIQRCNPVVTPQVINEVCVNLIKKADFKEDQIRELIESFYAKYRVISLDRALLTDASDIRERYSLSFWDSLIVSGALHSSTDLLYSEDMQDGLKIDDRLQIINPFADNSVV